VGLANREFSGITFNRNNYVTVGGELVEKLVEISAPRIPPMRKPAVLRQDESACSETRQVPRMVSPKLKVRLYTSENLHWYFFFRRGYR